MYRLYEVIKKEDKESQSIYPYESRTLAEGDFDTKTGAAMKAQDELAHFLLLLDNTGVVLQQKFIGESEIAPRLIDTKWQKNAETGVAEEIANMAKYDTEDDVHANFYTKRGNAKKNANVLSIMLRGISTNGESMEYDYWVRVPEPVPTPEPEPVEE